jgi:hypothetical protein
MLLYLKLLYNIAFNYEKLTILYNISRDSIFQKYCVLYRRVWNMGPRNTSAKAKIRNRSRIGKGRSNDRLALAKEWLEVSTMYILNLNSCHIIIYLYTNRNRRNPFHSQLTWIWSDWSQESGWMTRLWMGILNSLNVAAKNFNIYRKSLHLWPSSTPSFAARVIREWNVLLEK